MLAILLALLASNVSADCNASGKLSPIYIKKQDRTHYYKENQSALLTLPSATAKFPYTPDGATKTPEVRFFKKVTIVFPSYFMVGTGKGIEFEYLKITASDPPTLQHRLMNSKGNYVEVQLHGRNLDREDENAPDYYVALSILYQLSDFVTESTYEPNATRSASYYLTGMLSARYYFQELALSVFFPPDTKTLYTYYGTMTDKDDQCKPNILWIVYDHSDTEVGNIHVSKQILRTFNSMFGGDIKARPYGNGIFPVTKHVFNSECCKVVNGTGGCEEGTNVTSKNDAKICTPEEETEGEEGQRYDDGEEEEEENGTEGEEEEEGKGYDDGEEEEEEEDGTEGEEEGNGYDDGEEEEEEEEEEGAEGEEGKEGEEFVGVDGQTDCSENNCAAVTTLMGSSLLLTGLLLRF